MATATTSILSPYEDVNSEATISGPEGVGERTIVGCSIGKNVIISIHKPEATAVVIRPIVIGLTPTEEGYMASSHFSNAYELGATLHQAIRNYLEFLVDELLWLRNNEENLSSSIREELYLLQSYLRIV
jgi:hypothetical protein